MSIDFFMKISDFGGNRVLFFFLPVFFSFFFNGVQCITERVNEVCFSLSNFSAFLSSVYC